MGVLSASEADSAIEHLECEGKPFLVRFSSSTGILHFLRLQNEVDAFNKILFDVLTN